MPGAVNRSVSVTLGEAAFALGTLNYTRQGVRESSAFAYAPSWLESPLRFAVSPDLPLTAARQFKKAA